MACQRRTGSVFAALASFATPFRVTGPAIEYVRVGGHGARFTFRFCPVCGTTLYHTEAGEDARVSVAVGAFADPSFSPPGVSVYDSRRHPWVRLPPGTQAFDRDPPWPTSPRARRESHDAAATIRLAPCATMIGDRIADRDDGGLSHA